MPTVSNSASLAMAPPPGSYTPGPGIISPGASGSSIIGPGLSVISLPPVMTTVPVVALLTPAPPPEALPVKVEPISSTRPLGIAVVGGSTPEGHSYSFGSPL